MNRCSRCLSLIANDLPQAAQAARALQIKPDEYRPLQHVYEAIAWHYKFCPVCIAWKDALINSPTGPVIIENQDISAARTQETPPASGGEVPHA